MSTDTAGKVDAARLARDAYLYVRQSTLAQVTHNTESTLRQYDLRGRAVALGWPAARIHVIDSTKATPGRRPPTGKGSSTWSLRCPWAGPGLSWAWSAHAWPATTRTGTCCWRSAPTTTP